jgi:hypothetical protein
VTSTARNDDNIVKPWIRNILVSKNSIMSMKLLGIISVGSVLIDLLPIRFSTFARYKKKKKEGSTMGQFISYS